MRQQKVDSSLDRPTFTFSSEKGGLELLSSQAVGRMLATRYGHAEQNEAFMLQQAQAGKPLIKPLGVGTNDRGKLARSVRASPPVPQTSPVGHR